MKFPNPFWLFAAVSGLAIWSAKAENIAFFYALDQDLAALREAADRSINATNLNNRTIYRFKFGPHEVYAEKMGSGCVETAVSATSLLTHFPCDLAISVGPVGALGDDLGIGQWTRVSTVVPYQNGTDEPSGFRREADISITPLSQPLETACASLTLGSANLVVASGEVFVASSTRRSELAVISNAAAVDMNLFGLTKALTAAKVPHLALRVASDRANDNACVDFRAFSEKYSGEGARLAIQIIRRLPPNPKSPESYPALNQLLNPSKR